MLERCKNAHERWGGVHQLIDRWLGDRRQLIVAFDQLSRATGSHDSEAHLQHFCQIMLDYVSAGHFGVYEQLNNEAQAFKDIKALELAKQIYPRIEVITQALLAFNDRCDNGDCRDEGVLAQDLKHISVYLHERFELEDCLIEVLHTAHKAGAVETV